jgi:hypothetical protein
MSIPTDLEAFISLTKTSPWTTLSTKSGVLISKHNAPTIHLFKGSKHINQGIDRIFRDVQGVDTAKKVDKTMVKGVLLEKIDENTDLVYLRYKVFWPIRYRSQSSN